MKKTTTCSKVWHKPFNESDSSYRKIGAQSATLEQNSKPTEAGTAYTQQVTIVADVDGAYIESLAVPQTMQLTTERGDVILLGDTEYKLRLKSSESEISPVKLVFERESPYSAF